MDQAGRCGKVSGVRVAVTPGEDPGSVAQRCPLQMPTGCNGSRIESGMTKKVRNGNLKSPEWQFVTPGEDPGSMAQRCPLQMPTGCNGSRIESGMTAKKFA